MAWIKEFTNKGLQIQHLRTDGGGEYQGELTPYLKELGITHEPTAPHSPQSNGKAERLNRTLAESVRAMLFQANMPETFWAEAINTAAFICNYLPSEAVDNKIPWELWHGQPLQIETLRKLHPFGSIVHSYVPRARRWSEGKWVSRSNVGCFIGYVSSGTHEPTDSYKIWNFEAEDFEVSHNLLFTVKFPKPGDFNEPPIAPPVPSAALPAKPPVDRQIFDEIIVEPPPALQVFSTSYSTLPDGDPPTLADALRRPDANEWVNAMKDELKSIQDNGTWFLCDLPPGRKSIGTKWVFKTKRDGNNKFERHKCRLVAKGYAQIPGVDYDKTFAPVVRIESVRALFAFAAFRKQYVLHVDCKHAFLNGNSDLRMYVNQPEGFVSKKHPRKVLQLKKSLYGLKQAPRIWYLLLCSVILNLGFKPLETDPSIYFSSRLSIFLAVYVDDILIFGPDESTCEDIFHKLNQHFAMKNLGYPKTFLGLNITRQNDGSISINQSGYIDRMLNRFHMSEALLAKTPLNPLLPLLKAAPLDKRADLKLFQELIGSLNHLAVFSRPDISCAVSTLSQFLQDPTETHMKAARHVLRYLKGTNHLCITYGACKELRILGFSDSNWGGNLNDRKSTTGYLYIINNGLVSWTSHKQTTVAVSTLEAEYMALSDASREAIARSQLYDELRIKLPPPLILSDSRGALDICDNPTNYQKAKHIDIRYHFIRHILHEDKISIDHIPGTENPADALTKAVNAVKHQHCLELMNLR
jgi:hypothetical protein